MVDLPGRFMVLLCGDVILCCCVVSLCGVFVWCRCVMLGVMGRREE